MSGLENLVTSVCPAASGDRPLIGTHHQVVPGSADEKEQNTALAPASNYNLLKGLKGVLGGILCHLIMPPRPGHAI